MWVVLCHPEQKSRRLVVSQLDLLWLLPKFLLLKALASKLHGQHVSKPLYRPSLPKVENEY